MGLTFVIAVYGQPLMLEKWFETLRSYPEEVLNHLSVVIVDDHGTPPVDVPMQTVTDADVRVYRVQKDIPWNQGGARNLGMQEAPTDWCVMLDPDMVIEPEVAKRLMRKTQSMKQGELVKLLLRYTNDVYDSTSPNAYLIHREDFERVQGYAEEYAGHKGWSDVELMHTLQGIGVRFLKPQGLWVRYYRTDDIADAMVKTLNRSVAHNRSLHIKRMGLAKRSWAKWIKRETTRIRFRWTRVV